MIMISEVMKIAFVTGHFPLNEVKKLITCKSIILKTKQLNTSLTQDFRIRKPKIAILGLNPHAGEDGLLGDEETEHIIPVQINNDSLKKVCSIALNAHRKLKCRGVTRSDFRYYNNKFYLLEINTQPGMTALSLVPEIASYLNIKFINLIEKILEDASINK